MRSNHIRCALSAGLAIHVANISHLDAALGKIGTICPKWLWIDELRGLWDILNIFFIDFFFRWPIYQQCNLEFRMGHAEEE